MLSNRLIQTFAACAATVLLVSSAPAFAAQGTTRSNAPRTVALGHRPAAKGPLVHATGFNGATLDPNGLSVVGPLSLLPPDGNSMTNVSRSTPRPDGNGAVVDPNG